MSNEAQRKGLKELSDKIVDNDPGVIAADWEKFDQDLFRFNESDEFAWYGTCFGQTSRILTTAIPTACVGYKDNEIVFAANPRFLDQLSYKQRCFVYCHEIEHIIRSHLIVMEDHPEAMSELNIVMDALINEALMDYGNAWTDKDKLKWKSSDGKECNSVDLEVLKKLINEAKHRGGKATQDLPSSITTKNFYREYTSEGLRKYLPRNQKTGGGNIFEETARELYGDGEFFNDDSVPDEVKDSLLEGMIDAASKSRGRAPAHLEEFMDKIKDKSNRNYRMMMRGLGRSTHIKVTRSWTKWNKRNPNLSMPVRPGRYFKSLPKVLVMADTSGSIGSDELVAFIKEINNLTSKCIIDMAWVDAHFDEDDPAIFYRNIKSTRDFIKRAQKPIGRGGTYFKEFYDYALKSYGEYQHILILTDGWTDDIPKRLAPGQQLALMTPKHKVEFVLNARECGFKVAVIEDL